MLNPDFRDMLSALCDEGVEFIVVGAYALAAYGSPRATGDIDIWVRATDENAQRVWRALQSFGAPLFDLSVDDLKKPDIVFQVGVVPRRIDIITSITAVTFDEAWPERKEVEIAGLKFAVLGRNHLIQNKRAVARPKDIADIAWLEGEDK